MYAVCHIEHSQDFSLLGEVGDVFDRVLGAGYVDRDQLRDLALDPDAMVLAALDRRSTVVGAATASVMPAALAGRLRARAGADALPDVPAARLGLLRTAAVLREHRGRGLGSRLLDQRLAWLVDHGVTHAACLVWADSPAAPSRLLERRGFRRAASLPGWWRGQPCLVCGASCFCAAELMTAGPLLIDATEGATEARPLAGDPWRVAG